MAGGDSGRGRASALALALLAVSCAAEAPEAEDAGARRPALLLVTLDTTRADAVEPEATAVATPNLAALAGRGLRFTQAYTTAPMTLPAHASMMTGLDPAAHGIHQNDRALAADRVTLAVRLHELGYRTAAFVSGYPLDRQFGLARGFDHYDDDLGRGLAERAAAATTDRALAWLAADAAGDAPRFLWVHYFDPHEPYDPPEPFRSRYAASPYHGEIASMDRELGRLLRAFEESASGGATKILVVGDHGEGLGEHGEALHGNLLYQGVVRVPLLVAGTGVAAGERSEPVSVRAVFDTVLGWAAGEERGLLAAPEPFVLAEAMKAYLDYGWQPQVMGVQGRWKVILSGRAPEVYDLVADPRESRDLAGQALPDRELLRALQGYALPADDAGAELDPEARRRLASLGYVGAPARPRLRADAPHAREMTHLFADLDRGSGLFVHEEYRLAIPIFERVLEEDPANLMVTLRLAVAHSVLGSDRRALDYFRRAERLAPGSADVRHYLAMHHFKSGDLGRAAELFEAVLAESPARLPALETLARIRAEQGRTAEAAALVERAVPLRRDPVPGLLELGELRMALGDTPGALRAFERARDRQGAAFSRWLELGVLYLADRRLEAARDSLDRVPPSHPDYPMALFKRAQVSVLLEEPDAAEHIRRARERADESTRSLLDRETLFRAAPP